MIGSSIGRLFVEIGADTRGLDKGFDQARNKVKGFGGSIKKHGMAVGAGMTAIGIGAKVMSNRVTESFMNIDSAMAGVRKTTGMTKPEIAEMKEEFIALSKTMPTAAHELASIGAVAGQLGITGKENILDFTKSVAMMSTAFDMSEESAATAMAKMANIYDIPISEVSRLGSAINVLGNTTAAKESQIMDYSMSLGAAAKQLGFTSQETIAMGATLISMGMDASDAGTRLNSAFTSMGAKSEKAGALLGMTGEEFKRAFSQDQMGVMQAMVAELGKIEDPLERNTVAAEVFGRVGAKAINALGGDLQGLTTNLENANKGYAENTSLTEEYANATDTLAAKLEIANNKTEAAAIAMGGAMAPATIAMAEATSMAAGLIEGLPGPMQSAVGISMKLSESFIALGPALMGISTIGPGTTAAFKGMAMGVKSLNLAFLANPIVIAIALIIAILALIYLAWTNNWGGIQEKTQAAFEFLNEVFNKIIDIAKIFVTHVISSLKNLGDKLLFLLGPIGMIIYAFKHWEEIKVIVSRVLNGVINFITGLAGAFGRAGRAIMNALVSGVTAGINRAVQKVRDGLAKIRRLMPGSDAKEGPLSDITASGRALMTTFEKGILSSDAKPAEAFAARTPDVAGTIGGTAGSGTTSNASTINIGTVNLTKDYDFEAMMNDINKHQQSKRIQRGISPI